MWAINNTHTMFQLKKLKKINNLKELGVEETTLLKRVLGKRVF
jgi:hypothetical protein